MPSLEYAPPSNKRPTHAGIEYNNIIGKEIKTGELDQIVLSLVSKVSSNMGCHDELPSLSNITTQK